ncbi:DUF4314 domain-containing protein [Anaerotignum propionicum]|uniref:DUF4314 domain-containing protein n=1 Tax=Anaerotignum propionicum DSM 1682 TaxID=991789 RepID=A0A0X1U9F3_ANAPI|nr:DUF4314 domain-containing protein [Anaerotignum propionicum]AMJ41555.1 hypothetical protein CPRO_19730 [Anaerotignum propionicum DSM 1682]SHE71313.1 hypothetical protein SAMN02745151_01575 [[Clostridium] propionicum DSM 1682] [Anaerotignum propionicum DSM 1682]
MPKEAVENRQFGFTKEGLAALKRASDPAVNHSYRWFVFENLGLQNEVLEYAPSLEEAIHRYQSSVSGKKLLGVTKDEIATVDILIKENGVERIHSNYKDSDSFNHDIVILQAVSKLEQLVQQNQQKQELTGEGFKMRGFSREYIEKIKEQYPVGTRLELTSDMDDSYAPVLAGTQGEVISVDDIGTLHMQWDNGRSLGIVIGEDYALQIKM